MIEDGMQSGGKPPFLVRRRTVFTWLVPLLLLAATLVLRRHRIGDGGWPAYFSGLGLIVLGEIVRFWAAGYIAKDAEIATGGLTRQLGRKGVIDERAHFLAERFFFSGEGEIHMGRTLTHPPDLHQREPVFLATRTSARVRARAKIRAA